MKGVIRDSIYWKRKSVGFTSKECGSGPMGIPVYQCEPILKLNDSANTHVSIDSPVTSRKRPKRSKKRSKSYGRLPGPEPSPRVVSDRPLSISSQPVVDSKGRSSRRNSLQTFRRRFGRGANSSIPSIHSDGDIQKVKGKYSQVHVPAATTHRQDRYHEPNQRNVLNTQRGSPMITTNTTIQGPPLTTTTTTSAASITKPLIQPMNSSRSNTNITTTTSTINNNRNTEDPLITIPLSRLHLSIRPPHTNSPYSTNNTFTAASPIHPIESIKQRQHGHQPLPMKSTPYNSTVNSYTDKGKKQPDIVRPYGSTLASGSNHKRRIEGTSNHPSFKKGNQTPPLRLGTSSTQEPISSPSAPSSLQRSMRQQAQHQTRPVVRNQVASNLSRRPQPHLTPMVKDAISSFNVSPRSVPQPRSTITTELPHRLLMQQQQISTTTQMKPLGQRTSNTNASQVVPSIVVSPPTTMNAYSGDRQMLLSGVRPIATVPYSADRGPVADANYLLRRPGSIDPVEDTVGRKKIASLQEGFKTFDLDEEFEYSVPHGLASPVIHPKQNQAIILKTNQTQDFNDHHNRSIDNSKDLIPESGNSRSMSNRKWACCGGVVRDSASIISDDMSSIHLPVNSMTTPPSISTHDLGMGPQISELDDSDQETVLSSVTDASRWVPYTSIHQQGFPGLTPHSGGYPLTPTVHRPIVSNDFLSGLQQLGTLDTATWYGHHS